MPVSHAQVKTDVAAAQAAIATVAAHFQGNPYYWSHPRDLTSQAAAAMASVLAHFVGASGSTLDPTK